jgi:hypothetical protein
MVVKIIVDESSRELWSGLRIPFHPNLRTRYLHTKIKDDTITVVMETYCGDET